MRSQVRSVKCLWDWHQVGSRMESPALLEGRGPVVRVLIVKTAEVVTPIHSQQPRTNVIKLFTAASTQCSYSLCFSLAKPFQSSLMLWVRPEPTKISPFHVLFSRVGSGPYLQILDYAGKGWIEQTPLLIWPIRKKFYNTRSQCYNYFFPIHYRRGKIR